MSDLRANVERPAEERPVRILPPVPDVEPPEGHGYWHGSATGRVEHWKARALAAEAELAALRGARARWRFRP